MSNGCINVLLKDFDNLLLSNLIILITSIGCDGETWRNRDSNVIHLCQVGTLATKQFAHLRITFSLSVAEGINTFLTHNVIYLCFL